MSEAFDDKGLDGGDRLEALGRPRLIKINTKRIALGMFWQVTAKGTKTVAEAKELAAQAGVKADLYVARASRDDSSQEDGQFGLGRKRDGLEARAIAGAAALADRNRGSWLGVFRLPEPDGGIWYCAVRDDLILPDGDWYYFAHEEEEARKRFKRDLDVGGWGHIFAPKDWHDEAEDLPFIGILSDAADPKIAETNPFATHLKTIVVFLVFLSVLVGAGITYLQWSKAKQQERAIQEKRRALENAMKAANTTVALTPQWYKQPLPADWLAACAEAMRKVDLHGPGWKAERIVCSAASGRAVTASFGFVRSTGTGAWLQKWLAAHGAPEAALDPNGRDAMVSVSAGALTPRRVEAILDRDSATSALVAISQATGVKISLGKPRVPSAPAGVKPEQFVPPPYGPMRFQAVVGNLEVWSGLLARIPGLVLQDVAWEARTGTFTVTGDVYVQNGPGLMKELPAMLDEKTASQ